MSFDRFDNPPDVLPSTQPNWGPELTSQLSTPRVETANYMNGVATTPMELSYSGTIPTCFTPQTANWTSAQSYSGNWNNYSTNNRNGNWTGSPSSSYAGNWNSTNYRNSYSNQPLNGNLNGYTGDGYANNGYANNGYASNGYNRTGNGLSEQLYSTSFTPAGPNGQPAQLVYVNRDCGQYPNPMQDPLVQWEINQGVQVARSMQLQYERNNAQGYQYRSSTTTAYRSYESQGWTQTYTAPQVLPPDTSTGQTWQETPAPRASEPCTERLQVTTGNQAQRKVIHNPENHSHKEVAPRTENHPRKLEFALEEYTRRDQPEVISPEFLKLQKAVDPMLNHKISEYYPILKHSESVGCAAFVDQALHDSFHTQRWNPHDKLLKWNLIVENREDRLKEDHRFTRQKDLKTAGAKGQGDSWDINNVEPGDILVAHRRPYRDNNGHWVTNPPCHMAIMWTNGMIANNDSHGTPHIMLSPVTKLTSGEYDEVRVYRPTGF